MRNIRNSLHFFIISLKHFLRGLINSLAWLLRRTLTYLGFLSPFRTIFRRLPVYQSHIVYNNQNLDHRSIMQLMTSIHLIDTFLALLIAHYSYYFGLNLFIRVHWDNFEVFANGIDILNQSYLYIWNNCIGILDVLQFNLNNLADVLNRAFSLFYDVIDYILDRDTHDTELRYNPNLRFQFLRNVANIRYNIVNTHLMEYMFTYRPEILYNIENIGLVGMPEFPELHIPYRNLVNINLNGTNFFFYDCHGIYFPDGLRATEAIFDDPNFDYGLLINHDAFTHCINNNYNPYWHIGQFLDQYQITNRFIEDPNIGLANDRYIVMGAISVVIFVCLSFFGLPYEGFEPDVW